MTSLPHPLRSRVLLLGLVVIAVVSGYLLRDFLSFETLRTHREALLAFRDSHYLASVVIFIGAYFLIAAFSLPGAVLATLTGGFLFSTFPGALFNVTGAALGATALFAAARWGFGARLAERMETSEGTVHRIKRGIDENQWSMLFLIRLVPAVPFFAANIIPAMVGVSLSRFMISTFLGIIPGAIVYTSIGAGLGQTFDRGESPDLGVVFEPHILLPVLGLCLLAALPLVLKLGSKGKGAV